MKKKDLIISISISVIILLLIVYLMYRYLTISPCYDAYSNKHFVEKYKPYYQYIDENLNYDLRDNFYANKKIKEINDNLKPFIPKDSDMFKPNSEKELMNDIDNIVPENIGKIKDYLINHRIIRWMKAKKEIKSLDFKVLLKYAHPIPPTFETIKETAIYWYLLSRYLEKEKEYKNSLILSQGIFYLSRDWEREYSDQYISIIKTMTQEICRIGCKSILIWASKPKPQDYTLSKNLAKDILEFVKSEYPPSLNLRYERKEFEDNLNSRGIPNQYKEEYNLIDSLRSTKAYKNLLDDIYEKPQAFIDKPLYEIRNELEAYKDKLNDLFGSLSKSNINISLIIRPEETLILHLLNQREHDYIKMKKSHEQKLADLEFTAIALAINSYASENNKMPESMEELSKWFGQELPRNRLTNEPYVIDLKGEHLLYNKGINEIANLESKNTDDIYFDFKL